MKKPSPESISPTFYFTHNDIRRCSIPLLFKDFMVSKWNDCSELIKITSTKLNDIQSLEKWEAGFKSVATKCTDNVEVASFASKMGEYLGSEDGINEFLDSYQREHMKRSNKQEDYIKERIMKKLRIEQYRALEYQIDHEISDNSDLSCKRKKCM